MTAKVWHAPSVGAASDRAVTSRGILLVVCFVLFLYPASIDGIGVNYSFVLLPLFYLAMNQQLSRPRDTVLILMGLYTVIFIVASISQTQFQGEAIRRIASFIIFMSMFTYMFVRIDEVMIASFKTAIVGISLLLSLWSMYLFFIEEAGNFGFEAKDAVGSQRVGFIYLIAFWLVYLSKASTKGYLFIKYFSILVLLIGLLLTFSRSSIVGLLVSVSFFAMAGFIKWLSRPDSGAVWRGVGGLAIIALLLILLGALVPITFTFFETRLFSYLMNLGGMSEELGNPGTSAGTRIVLWQIVLNFVANNPLTGAGYLGIWSLVGDYSGSAHSQYADVLLRTGILGLLGYLFLLCALLRYLFATERALFWGLIGVLAYGMFHETFKESQGGFVLAFMLGMMSRYRRRCDDRIRRGGRTVSAPGPIELGVRPTAQRGDM